MTTENIKSPASSKKRVWTLIWPRWKNWPEARSSQAFGRYLDTEEFQQKVRRFKADARTCVEAIRSAGGKVSLTHPYQMGAAER